MNLDNPFWTWSLSNHSDQIIFSSEKMHQNSGHAGNFWHFLEYCPDPAVGHHSPHPHPCLFTPTIVYAPPPLIAKCTCSICVGLPILRLFILCLKQPILLLCIHFCCILAKKYDNSWHYTTPKNNWNVYNLNNINQIMWMTGYPSSNLTYKRRNDVTH